MLGNIVSLWIPISLWTVCPLLKVGGSRCSRISTRYLGCSNYLVQFPRPSSFSPLMYFIVIGWIAHLRFSFRFVWIIRSLRERNIMNFTFNPILIVSVSGCTVWERIVYFWFYLVSCLNDEPRSELNLTSWVAYMFYEWQLSRTGTSCYAFVQRVTRFFLGEAWEVRHFGKFSLPRRRTGARVTPVIA